MIFHYGAFHFSFLNPCSPPDPAQDDQMQCCVRFRPLFPLPRVASLIPLSCLRQRTKTLDICCLSCWCITCRLHYCVIRNGGGHQYDHTNKLQPQKWPSGSKSKPVTPGAAHPSIRHYLLSLIAAHTSVVIFVERHVNNTEAGGKWMWHTGDKGWSMFCVYVQYAVCVCVCCFLLHQGVKSIVPFFLSSYKHELVPQHPPCTAAAHYGFMHVCVFVCLFRLSAFLKSPCLLSCHCTQRVWRGGVGGVDIMKMDDAVRAGWCLSQCKHFLLLCYHYRCWCYCYNGHFRKRLSCWDRKAEKAKWKTETLEFKGWIWVV